MKISRLTGKRATLAGLLLAAGLFGNAQAEPHRFVVILQGTGTLELREVPDIDGDGVADPAICVDVDLADARTGHVIGTGTECLSEADLDGQGAKPIATTTFNFPGGTLVQRGKLTAQPVLWEPQFNSDVDPKVQLVTGAFPAPGVNNVLSGTGRFKNAMGRVRLSGAAGDNPDGTTTLNCIFVIELY